MGEGQEVDDTAQHLTLSLLLQDILVPYFVETKRRLGLKPDHICILVIDCWFGWISEDFTSWLQQHYPWIRRLYVPACCTPVAQPADCGLIAKLKAQLREQFADWLVQLAGDAEVKTGAAVMKPLLFQWMSAAQDRVDRESVERYWKKTGLYESEKDENQRKATDIESDLFQILFPNTAIRRDTQPVPEVKEGEEEAESTVGGEGFLESSEEDETKEGEDGMRLEAVQAFAREFGDEEGEVSSDEEEESGEDARREG